MYIHIKLFLFLIMFVLPFLVYSQAKVIKGNIMDEYNNPVEGATIVLYNELNNIVTYKVSDQYGAYKINGDLNEGSILEVTHISFLKQQKIFTRENLEMDMITLNFTLIENTNDLEEVIIISRNEERDTVSLDLKKLNLYDDDNLKDILQKIPNFKLGNDGSIIYKGKSIDKILVNQKESFVSQNSIALESIENKIIEGISVINNYQDNFSLDFEENEESVLNIDTKEQFKNIINGSLSAKYGYQNKYEFKSKGLFFSKTLNAFLTNNTNNIGNTTINFNEVKRLFSEGQPFSTYQASTLNTLFATNENLKKDFFSSTNLTIRNQSRKIKTSGLFYYITPNRTNSSIKTINTINNIPMLNSVSETNSKTHSLLGAFSIAYKLSDNTIATYNINANYIDNKDNSTIENQLYENGNQSEVNTISSGNSNKVSLIFNQLSLTSKLQKNLILDNKIGVYNESSKLFNDYLINPNTITDLQNYKFLKNVFQGSSKLKYKVATIFIPSIGFDYKKSAEKINDKNLNNQTLIDRDINDYTFNLEIEGNKLFKKVGYYASIGLNNFTNSITNNNETFIPIDISIDYENRLNRIILNISRLKAFNDLETGINTIQPLNIMLTGNTNFPGEFNVSNHYDLNYTYSNLFDAEIFSLSLTYNNYNNQLRKNFIQQNNGISQFEYFIANKSSNYKIASYYSKTLFQLKYPTKVDLSLDYKRDFYPYIINTNEVDVITTSTSPGIHIETITNHLLNFKLSTKTSFIDDKTQDVNYSSAYTNGTFSVLLRNEKWKGGIHFLYDNNEINKVTYERKNIDFDLSYTKNKITYSIDARHLGELFSLIENESYNSQFFISDGIGITTINNQSLNYIIFGIKYNL